MTAPALSEVEKEHANIEKFLRSMNEYTAPIPDAVVMHVLAEAGLSTSDRGVHRTLNVACQKFITDVLVDCATIAKQRSRSQRGKKSVLDLQVSDLKTALDMRGVHVHRPDFIVSIPKREHEE
jgi:transcription initiation factor TFIID subunit 10